MLEIGVGMLVVLLSVCLMAAAWPVVLSPVFRQLRLSVGGSFCLGTGAGVVALFAGFLPTATLSGKALADDKEIKVLKAEADPVIGSDAIEIPTGRPEWIGQQPSFSGKVHTIAVASGPYATNKESLKALDQALVNATREYISEQLNSELAARMISFDARTIKRRFVKEDSYHDEAKYSVGKMHENFALLQFDSKFRSEVARSWNKVRSGSRLLQSGVIAGAALLVLGSVFGYFRADNATRGYYAGRLQFMAAAAILAVVGAGAVALRLIPWL
jgi:hypothetical protein